MSLNVAVLMGRLTKKPELSVGANGKEYLRFKIAVERTYSKKEDKITDFIDCVAFGKTAVFISTYFDKGQMIAVTGSLTSSSYTDKDGNNRYSLVVSIDETSFCGSKSQNTVPSTPTSAPVVRPNLNIEDYVEDDDDDSLPF